MQPVKSMFFQIPLVFKSIHPSVRNSWMDRNVTARMMKLIEELEPTDKDTLNDEQKFSLLVLFGMILGSSFDFPRQTMELHPMYPVSVEWDNDAGFYRIWRMQDDETILIGTFGPDGPAMINDSNPPADVLKRLSTADRVRRMNEYRDQKGEPYTEEQKKKLFDQLEVNSMIDQILGGGDD